MIRMNNIDNSMSINWTELKIYITDFLISPIGIMDIHYRVSNISKLAE